MFWRVGTVRAASELAPCMFFWADAAQRPYSCRIILLLCYR